MDRFIAYLGRLFVILFGLIIAIFVAACVATFFPLIGLDVADGAQEPMMIMLTVFLPFTASLFGKMIFLPAIIVIVIAEAFSFRAWVFYAITGGFIAVYVSFQGVDIQTEWQTNWLMGDVATGMVAGLAYWLVAGRKAGIVLDQLSGRADG